MLSTGFHEISMVSYSFSFVLKGVVGLSQLKAKQKGEKKYNKIANLNGDIFKIFIQNDHHYDH